MLCCTTLQPHASPELNCDHERVAARIAGLMAPHRWALITTSNISRDARVSIVHRHFGFDLNHRPASAPGQSTAALTPHAIACPPCGCQATASRERLSRERPSSAPRIACRLVSDRGMACGRFRVLGSDPERLPLHVSSGGRSTDRSRVRERFLNRTLSRWLKRVVEVVSAVSPRSGAWTWGWRRGVGLAGLLTAGAYVVAGLVSLASVT